MAQDETRAQNNTTHDNDSRGISNVNVEYKRVPDANTAPISKTTLRDRYEPEYRKQRADTFRAEKTHIATKSAERIAYLESLLKEQKNPDLRKNLEERIIEAKKDVSAEKNFLYTRTREANKASRAAIAQTHEQLQGGDLRISRLAQETDAVVVHAVPLDGWGMKNTSMNNSEVDTTSLRANDKISIIREKHPDLSVSVISAKERKPEQKMMYPFGLIVDGDIIASYAGDESTTTRGDARYRKGGQTLQTDPASTFTAIAQSAAEGYGWNESIVHNPSIKGILVDAVQLAPQNGADAYADHVKEYYPLEQESSLYKKYGTAIRGSARGIPTSGPYAGKSIVRIERERSGLQKALEYADTNYPELPVYLRQADGIYNRSGEKVEVSNLYGTTLGEKSSSVTHNRQARGVGEQQGSVVHAQSHNNPARGIKNVQVVPNTQSNGYDDSEREGAIEKEFGEKKSIEARAYNRDQEPEEAENGEEGAHDRERQLIRAQQAERVRAIREHQVHALNQARIANETSLKGNTRKMTGATRWMGLAIVLKVYIFQLIFAIISLIGFGVYGAVADFQENTTAGKVIGFFVDMKKYFPGEKIGVAMWGLTAVLTVVTFIGFLVWFYFTGLNPFRTTISFLITTLCFALNFLPVTNLLPWLVLWILYMNATGVMQQVTSVAGGVRDKL